MKKILMAHDGSKSSEQALKKAFEIAERFDSSLTVISVIPELYLTELMEMDRIRIFETLTGEARKMMEKIKKRTSRIRSLRTVITQGSPVDEILKTAKKITEGKISFFIPLPIFGCFCSVFCSDGTLTDQILIVFINKEQ